MTYYTADIIYSDGNLYRDHYFSVENGMVQGLAPLNTLDPRAFRDMIAFEDSLVVPGFVNSHTHSFQSLLKGFCDDKPFFDWRDQGLYKYSQQLTEQDIYHGALFAFGEMLKNGVTTVCDFFYINDQDNANANAVIRAAKDLGIRLTLARTMYDWDGAPKRFQETIDQAVNNTRKLSAEYANDPTIQVLPAPHSLHGASPEMVKAGADLAEELRTVFHLHVAEGEYERQMITEKYGAPPIQYLDKLGVLNNRMVGIHCVWLDESEIQLMADRKAGISYNPSSNMFLGDGVTHIKELTEAGVTISLGTDGGCSNNRASIIEEMRMTSLLQKVVHHDASVTTAEQMLAMGTVNGGLNLNLPVGKLEKGYGADFVVVDLEDLSMQPRQNPLKNLVYAMMPSAIRSVYTAGRKVYDIGEILTVPESDIVEKVIATTGSW
ncbi:MAG: amidohydrolase family protein [Vampirovibrio sp.]|nr:amidohydrolase family protein [Vampirovibrio sp.]